MKKAVIFLDIDGVLNSTGYFKTNLDYLEDKGMGFYLDSPESRLKFMVTHLDGGLVRNLNYMLTALELKGFDFQIQISSSWRKQFSVDEIAEALWWKGLDYEYRQRVVGKTPWKMSSQRQNEIHWALEEIVEDQKLKPQELRVVVLDDIPVFQQTYLEFLKGRGFEDVIELNTDDTDGLIFSKALEFTRRITSGE